jgi:GAF domain-containing protein
MTGPLDDRIAAGVAQLRSAGIGAPETALDRIARTTILETEHERLRAALTEAGQRAAAASLARRDALAETARLIRESRALRDAYGDDMPRLEMTDAEELTGISRQTLYAELKKGTAHAA